MHEATIASKPPDSLKSTKWGLLAFLDHLLRDQDQYLTKIYANRDVGRLTAQLIMVTVLLTGFYGLIMGSYGDWRYMIAMVKVPVLYLLTVGICFPLLYIINVLMGSRLNCLQTLSLILVALTINSAFLGASAPIVGFFYLSGAGYNFIKVLHVMIFTIGGLWGMGVLLRALQGMCEYSNVYPKKAIQILRLWAVVFGFVGTQMAWILRPFIGWSDEPWQLFRSQGSNFYACIWNALSSLF